MQTAWRIASHQGAREVNADAVAPANGIVALADGIGDDLTATHAASPGNHGSRECPRGRWSRGRPVRRP